MPNYILELQCLKVTKEDMITILQLYVRRWFKQIIWLILKFSFRRLDIALENLKHIALQLNI